MLEVRPIRDAVLGACLLFGYINSPEKRPWNRSDPYQGGILSVQRVEERAGGKLDKGIPWIEQALNLNCYCGLCRFD